MHYQVSCQDVPVVALLSMLIRYTFDNIDNERILRLELPVGGNNIIDAHLFQQQLNQCLHDSPKYLCGQDDGIGRGENQLLKTPITFLPR